MSSHYVLNYFKYFLIYILVANLSKESDRKNFELYQVFMNNFLCQNDQIFIRIFRKCFEGKSFNTSKLYTADAHYSVKICSITFSYLLSYKYPPIFLDSTMQALILHSTLFRVLRVFKIQLLRFTRKIPVSLQRM